MIEICTGIYVCFAANHNYCTGIYSICSEFFLATDALPNSLATFASDSLDFLFLICLKTSWLSDFICKIMLTKVFVFDVFFQPQVSSLDRAIF
jgi:hypothetical protein